MKMKKVIAFMVVLGLAGCGSQVHQGPYGGHTEHWYATHTKQMAAEAKWCDAGSTHRENTKSCDAAYAGIQAVSGFN